MCQRTQSWATSKESFSFQDAFESMLEAEVTPYFAPFKVLLRVLRGVLFREDADKQRTRIGLHDQFITALEIFGLMLPPEAPVEQDGLSILSLSSVSWSIVLNAFG